MSIHQRDTQQRKASCIAALRTLAQHLGRTPSEREYKSHYHSLPDAPTPSQLRYSYGTWTAAVLDAGLTPLATNPPRNNITDDDLISEFVRVSNELGRLPPVELFRRNATFSNTPYERRWGTWREVQIFFALNHASRFAFTPEVRANTTESPKQRSLDLDCPLVYEPRNEFETIALFTLLAKDLGYRILSIRAAFPDAMLEKDGIEIPTEFEFLSSNYVVHCHERSADILCICWRIDCDLSPVKVICLEDFVLQCKGKLGNQLS